MRRKILSTNTFTKLQLKLCNCLLGKETINSKESFVLNTAQHLEGHHISWILWNVQTELCGTQRKPYKVNRNNCGLLLHLGFRTKVRSGHCWLCLSSAVWLWHVLNSFQKHWTSPALKIKVKLSGKGKQEKSPSALEQGDSGTLFSCHFVHFGCVSTFVAWSTATAYGQLHTVAPTATFLRFSPSDSFRVWMALVKCPATAGTTSVPHQPDSGDFYQTSEPSIRHRSI